MVIDLGALAIFLLGGFLGYRSGFFRQLMRLAALVVGFIAARYLAAPIGDLVSRGLDVSPFLANIVSFIAVFFLVSLAISVMASAAMNRETRRGVALTFLNRGLGGLVGAAKAGALVYLAIYVFSVLQPLGAAGSLAESPHMDLTRSVVGRNVLRNNYLQREVMPRAMALANIARILQQPALLREAAAHPDFETIVEHPDGQFLREPHMQAAILEGRWDILWEDGRVFTLFRDMELVEALNRLRFDDDGRLLPPDPIDSVAPSYDSREP